MNSYRQQNQANLGYFPTNLNVVRLEMSLIDFSDIQGKTIELNMCDLTGGVGDQLNEMNLYLKNLNIDSNCYYNELNENRFNECVKKYPYMTHLNADANFLKIGAKKSNSIDRRVFSIIRNNPPYGYDTDKNGYTIRLEKRFFEINTLHDIIGGIHILELPVGTIDKDLLNILSYRYDIRAFKFPKKEFVKFKQICIIMQRKKNMGRNQLDIDTILNDIDNDTMTDLDDVVSPVFSVSYNDFKKASKIHYFRHSKISQETLHSGAEQVWGEISKYNSTKFKRDVVLEDKPIIELLQGHISSLLASGRYNGIMGDLLIHGGSNKIVKEVIDYDDEGREIKIETEVLQPYIEITNSNGDIMHKDF